MDPVVIFVTSAAPNTATSKITIRLNKAPGTAASRQTAHIAWFVIN
jgi:hypothetical protein